MPAPPSSAVKAQNAANIASSKGNVGPTSGLGSNYGGSGSNSGYTNTNSYTSTSKPTGGGSISTSGTGGKNTNSTGSVNSTAGKNTSNTGNIGGQKASTSPMSGQGTSYNPSSAGAGRGVTAGSPPTERSPLGQAYHASSGPGTPRGPTLNAGSTRLGTGGLNAAAGNTSIAGNMVPKEVADAIRTAPTHAGIQKWQLNSMAETYRQKGMDLTANKLTEMARTISGEAINQTPDQRAAVANVMGNRLALGTSYDNMMRAFDANGYDASRVGDANAVYNKTQLGTDRMSQGIAAIANASSPTSSFNLTAPNAVKDATHYYNPQDANPRWGTRGGNEFTAYGDHIFGNPDQSPAAVRLARSDVGGLTRVAAAPVQPQTPSGVSPIPSPSGSLGPSQNLSLPPPGFSPGTDPYAGRTAPPQRIQPASGGLPNPPSGMSFTPSLPAPMAPRNPPGGMSFNPQLPPDRVQAGPVAPAQTAEQRMGISLPPALPAPGSMPGVLNPQTRQFEYSQYNPLSSVRPPQQAPVTVAAEPTDRKLLGGSEFADGWLRDYYTNTVTGNVLKKGIETVFGPQDTAVRKPTPTFDAGSDLYANMERERVTAVDPVPTGIPDSGRRLNPPGFQSPSVPFSDQGRKLTVASKPTADTFSPQEDPEETSVAPRPRDPYDPSFEGVSLTPKIAKKHERMNTLGEVGKVAVDVGVAPGLGDVIGRPIGRWVGSLGPDETSKIASSTRLAELSARNINEKASKAGYQGQAVTTKGLQEALKNPKKVLNAPAKEYTPLEKLIAKIEASKNGNTTSNNSADMEYLKKLSRGYQPFNNTYVSSY